MIKKVQFIYLLLLHALLASVLVCKACRNKILQVCIKVLFLGSQVISLLSPLHMVFSSPTVSLCEQSFSSYKDTRPFNQGSPIWLHLALIASLKTPSQNIVTFWGTRVKASIQIWGRYRSSHNNIISKNPLLNPIHIILLSTNIYWLLTLRQATCLALDK